MVKRKESCIPHFSAIAIKSNLHIISELFQVTSEVVTKTPLLLHYQDIYFQYNRFSPVAVTPHFLSSLRTGYFVAPSRSVHTKTTSTATAWGIEINTVSPETFHFWRC
jgi:hypothetical protein